MNAFFYFSLFCGVATFAFAYPTFTVNGVLIKEDFELDTSWNTTASDSETAFFKTLEKRLVEGDSLVTTVNEFTDKLLTNLDQLFKAELADPLSLPDIEKEISKKILFINYKGSLKLTEISATGLSSLQRSGDSDVEYDLTSKKLKFEVPLVLNEIDFTSQFKAKLPPISSTGRLTGEMKAIYMVASIQIDFQENKASLLEYKITDAGNIKLHFHVGKIVDWLLNLIGDTATAIFKSKIMGEVDTAITNHIQKVIDVINNIIS